MARNSQRCRRAQARTSRLTRLRSEVEALAEGQVISGGLNALPPDVEEQFLEHILAFERAERRALGDRLRDRGVQLTAPMDMDDLRLGAKLWEVIHALADVGVFLGCTDHLSDRELYVELVDNILREPVAVVPDRNAAYHFDLVEGCEDNDRAYLTYYADDAVRDLWNRRWPDEPLPDHREPPFDRDRFLPKPWP